MGLTPFETRSTVPTARGSLLRYVAVDGTPLERYEKLLKHQQNFLAWLDQRHNLLTEANLEIAALSRATVTSGTAAAKSETFRKYEAYSLQLVLLEAINGLETFYKSLFIELARAIGSYVPDSRIKGTVDAKILWLHGAEVDPTSIIFESRLLHDCDRIDDVSQMLIAAKYYGPQQGPARQRRLLSLKCIFQIRHTLSHNSGVVTQSDSAKFALLRYSVTPNQFIDPSKDDLGLAVLQFLREEARAYASWLRDATFAYLALEAARMGVSVGYRHARSSAHLFRRLHGGPGCFAVSRLSNNEFEPTRFARGSTHGG